MTKEYDPQGRQKLATDWAAISNIPDLVSDLGETALPGSGDWVVQYDGDTDTFFFTSSAAFSVDASDVTYTSTGSQWTATDVQVALHDLEREVDELQAIGAVGQTTGNFAITLSGMSSGGTGTLYYSKVGSKVTITARAAITGTSNTTAMQFTLPAALIPAHTQLYPCMQVEDNTNIAAQSAYCQVDAAGNISFGLFTGANGAGQGFTASGTKGLLAGWSVNYDTLV